MKIYVVGGAVRDVLLGINPHDIDYVVVGSTPSEMIEYGYKPIPATSFPVFHDSDGNEFALARTETKTGDGYHGFECEFDTDVTLEDDLYRRDLTINSMAVSVDDWGHFILNHDSKYVIDPFNGAHDLKCGFVRHISKHFSDDPVRALRAIRLANRYNFHIHSTTDERIKNMTRDGELDHLTPERIWLEVEKVFKSSKDIPAFFDECDRLGVTAKMFPKSAELYIGRYCLDLFVKSDCVNMEYAFLAMMNSNSHEYVELFCETLKLPNIYLELYRAYDNIISIIDIDWETNAHRVLNCFQKLNAFQSIDMLQFACYYITQVEKQHFSECESLIRMAKILQPINFESLSVEQRETLKGKDIGNAIKVARISKLNQFLIPQGMSG